MNIAFNYGMCTTEIPTKLQDYEDAPILIKNGVWIDAGLLTT